MRPEKVDRVKKKHLDNKKSCSKEEELCESKSSNSINGKLYSETDITDNKDSLIDNIDIDTLVEECLQTQVIENKGEHEIGDSATLMTCPSFQLTHEEEFKIFELFVRKENLMDGLFRLFYNFPGFLESFQRTLLSIGHGKGVDHDFVRIIDQKSMFIQSNLISGGTIKQSLDMFDEFRNVSEKIKNQILQFSLSVFRVCNR